MSESNTNFDLDFTKYFPKPAAATSSPAPSAVRARDFVCYARASATSTGASVDAPVVVLEDHEGSRRLLEKAITLYGLPVRSAGDVREFARALRQPPLPRLILLDVGLPRANGFQVLTQLRLHAQTSSIPVVLVTARSANADVIRGLSLGAEGYLSKPVTVKALRSVLDTVLQRAPDGLSE